MPIPKVSLFLNRWTFFETYRVWLEPTLVGQSVSVKVLCLASTVEEDIGNGHDPVVDDTSGGDKVDEPAEDDVGSVADLQESQAREDHDNSEANKGNTALGAVAESLWCSTFESQTVQTTSCAESICVAGAED